ncbi:PHD finger protein MBD-R2 [Musca autumnalis]|uniref:PHD finger protein MBD-R2 n=1 Tax=Musca autumnalis TaxID=221902 RepID=UPI003CF5E7B6
MGRKCCIAGCTSTSRLPEHHGVTYHSFPADENTRSIWIKNTKISLEKQITKSTLVCSRHFRRADFQPQRSGKYLLKQKVFPTVFPWGKIDAAQIEEDLEFLNTAGPSLPPTAVLTPSADNVDEDTKATVAATVAQIMAQTAELNAAAAALKNEKAAENLDDSGQDLVGATASPGVKYEPVSSFNPGARLEAQDFEGVWHTARIVEVDNDDREVLIKFEKTGKVKSTMVGTEEWIPMNSSRLRQKISTKPIPVFTLEEKCLARWTGPRKFPGTVKKILGNDTYEVLFDDGYVKNVRAIHMTKIVNKAEVQEPLAVALPEAGGETVQPSPSTPLPAASTVSPGVKRPSSGPSDGSKPKKRAASAGRKDWPLLDLSKLDIASLNLPEIPKDGEWTCHWVNDQPIGREGFLVVGEHRKPTVIVEDWRLPAGWIKHMYQRSNVLGKWDVILVSPSGKRFRSKADLKTFLEEQGLVYNPDIYDFSIHRRRAKDINCYVYTPGYVPQQPVKPKSALNFDVPLETKPLPILEPLRPSAPSPYMETPVAEPLPPIELLTSTASSAAEDKSVTQVEAEVPKQLLESAEASSTPTPSNTPTVDVKEEVVGSLAGGETTITATAPAGVAAEPPLPQVEDGYALIGGLKVQIVDNLFRCPEEGCSKNFRKENHLQIHVKHYHLNLAKLLGSCPKMQELAEKRTRPSSHDAVEPVPKNQIPNQQFFAKLHQQDLEQTRAHRRSIGALKSSHQMDATEATADGEIKTEPVEQNSQAEINTSTSGANNSTLDSSFTSTAADDSLGNIEALSKKSRFSPSKRTPGARKSNRQRTTRKYLTAAQATASRSMQQQNTSHGSATAPPTTADSSFSGVADFEETRHSFNATPDINKDSKKRKSNLGNTPLSSVESPITADSGSSSLQPMSHTDGTETAATQQYIKENGEIIKIVRMRQEEIINCLCKYGEEDGLMIQCELCLCWQHGPCHGIEVESQVPDKYVCYICRNPEKGRYSMQFKHDQDWLYEGKLPAANYHTQNTALMNKRADYLKKSHVLTGNLLELKNFMHSLKVKINIANNKCHPKLYLWATKWDDDVEIKNEIKTEMIDEEKPMEMDSKLCLTPTSKKVKSEPVTPVRPPVPNIPQPEAPIDPVECQQRLQEHIKIQQNLAMQRLNDIETALDALEQEHDLPDLHDADLGTTKDVLASFIKELDTVKLIAKLNALEHTKMALKNTAVAAV